MEVKNFTELPIEAAKLLYDLRLKDQKDAEVKDYVNNYISIIVDDIVYCQTSDDYDRMVMNKFMSLPKNSLRKYYIAHAVIIDNKVLKNRYGNLN